MKLSSAAYYDHATHWKSSSIPSLMMCITKISYIKALLHYALFHSRFGYQHVGIKNASENERKTLEKFSILHYALGKNTS